MRKLVSLSAAALALVALVTACATEETPKIESEVKKSEQPAPGDNTPAKQTTATASAPATADACGKTSTHEDCARCCWGAEAETTGRALLQAYDACVCNAAKAACSPECAARICSVADSNGEDIGGEDDSCSDCMVDTSKCESDGTAACEADPKCRPVSECLLEADCEGKDGGDSTEEMPTKKTDEIAE